MNDLPIPWTKLTVPGLRADVLQRQRLIDTFYDLLDYRLIIVAAPAGYGKTTLLVDAVREVELPTCWLSLDQLDQSPRRFLSGFIAALARQFPDFGKEATATLQAMSRDIDWDRLITSVVNDAYRHIKDHFIFVLDDYHHVDENEAIVTFINHFIQHVDENCHLILSTRTLPSLPDLPLMVARGQVGGLGFQALAFQQDEVQQLLRNSYGIAIYEQEAEQLTQQTEGWITGLLLAAQTMGFPLAQQAGALQASGVDLYEYLAQQVLENQSEAMQQFLLHSSLLEEFNAELCAAVLEPAPYLRTRSWQWFIGDATQRNLFVQSVGEEGWVRYHQLFREFLQQEMMRQMPAEANRVRRQLAAVYSQRQQWERAHQLYMELEDFEGAAALVEQAGSPMAYAGRHETLAHWLDTLPPRVVEQRPELLSLQGAVAVELGDTQAGLVYLNSAHAAALAAGDLRCRARTLCRRATAHSFLGNHEMALDDARTALELIGENESLHEIRASALRAEGLALHRLGRPEPAIDSLEAARLLQRRRGDMHMVARIDNTLGALYFTSGAREQARTVFEESLRYWREVGHQSLQRNMLNNLGVLAHTRGDYLEAAALLEEAVSLAAEDERDRVFALALASIGDLYGDLDAFNAALEAYEEADEIAREIEYSYLRRHLRLARTAIYRRQGALWQARQALDRARADGESPAWEEEAGRVALAEGGWEEAATALRTAVRGYEAQGLREEAAAAQMALAEVFHAAGRKQEATETLEAATASWGADFPHSLVVRARQQRNFLAEMGQEDPAVGGVKALSTFVARFEEEIPRLRRQVRRTVETIPFAAPQLAIRLFGEAEVTVGGEPVTRSDWQTPMAPALLYLLLENPTGLTKEEIGLYLWPDYSLKRLKVIFQKTIYRLRRALLSDAVIYDEETQRYRFNPLVDYMCDVERFRSRLLEARTAADPHEQKAAYRAALDLYRGPYLADGDFIWAGPTREALAEAYRAAALDLAELYLREEAHEMTLALCRRLLTSDACLEEAHRLAMRAHAARGNIASVVRQYQQCQEALDREIAVSPSRRTVDLFQQLTGAV
ncbi:MAG: tetratricopeptide repeat protein [Candidatus Promineifilaceae bacterium]|nr:tetratricopeptide repeat protein [Candidatus Promineifilaceae bacterium]